MNTSKVVVMIKYPVCLFDYRAVNIKGPEQVQTLGIDVDPKDETKGQFLQWREGI